ncbi:MAG: hypothetical protein QM796_01265 [Chthoniobacteraceae bacterium]
MKQRSSSLFAISSGWRRLSVVALLLALSPLQAAEPDDSAPDGTQVVYHDQLGPANSAGNGWSESATTTAPGDGSRYRGPFQAQPVALSLNGLPLHSWVRVRFNLFIVGSWDGSSPVWGPDLWSLQVRGAQRLFFTTFGNMGDFVNNNAQSFPDEYPWGKHKSWTGAADKNVLGSPRMSSPSTRRDLNDGVYPIDLIFPHSAASLVLDFAGIYDDPPSERQSWGVGDLEVTTLTTPPTVDTSALPGLWDDLASDNAIQADDALWKMVAAGSRANDFITARVAEIQAAVKSGTRGTPPVTGLEALRLHRAHRIIRLLGIEGPNASFAIDHLVPEYFGD